MQILITGGAGFIGSNLIKALKYKNIDAEITSLDNYSSGSEKNHTDGVRYIRGNTWDISSIEELQKFKPELVFHLGEYPRIVLSFDEINKTYKSNTFGTQQILQYCVEKKAKLIYSGSSAIFVDKDISIHDYNLHLNPYVFTKATNIDLIHNYKDWFGLDFVITYFYNVYGSDQIKEGPYATVLGIFETQFENNEKLTVVKPGTQRRIFTHIDDIIEGLILVAFEGSGDGYHLCSTDDYSILDIVNMFEVDYEFISERRGERVKSSVVVNNRVQKELGWKAVKKLEDYIKTLKHNNMELNF